MIRAGIACLVLLLLAACGRANLTGGQAQELKSYDVAEPAAKQAPASSAQIAYAYTYGYTLAADRVAQVQSRHAALCRALGPARCIVLDTNLDRGTASTEASLHILVDARIAAAFGQKLDAVIADADGEQVARSVSAEDVTKQLVDTEARVRAREALAARLLAVISGTRGSVADLVAAEKAYAGVQEELDAARTLAATLRQRVAMSEITVNYNAATHAGTFGPVAAALDGAADSFVASLAAAVTFVIAALPWLLVGTPVVLAARALWRRFRGWRARRRGARGV